MTIEQLFRAKGRNLLECMLITTAFTNQIIGDMFGQQAAQNAQKFLAARTAISMKQLAEIYDINIEECFKGTHDRMVALVKKRWEEELQEIFGNPNDVQVEPAETSEDQFIQQLNAKFKQQNRE